MCQLRAYGQRRLVHLADLLYQFQNLLPFSFAQIEKANANRIAIVDCLNDPAEPKWQSLQMEFRFHAGVDANRKARFGEDAAAPKAQIEDAAAQC